ncbi:uncharacterized protein LOC123564214 isoform X2 [Mercenaria mercenaria]|uniref:uncharacterized protein LOC123564214 isoform X2 n=1 Tax=Mercenaria mercenaria TaxID=6596 RepID=UPI00234F0466|nr:uncharacterized protein LOC123564214 isoform X2 [Mercenaria mercenaria]
MDFCSYITFALIAALIGQSLASHFRGAIISWKPGSNQREIDVDYRISWRMSYGSYFTCSDNTIKNGISIGGHGKIECFSNCYGTFGYLYYKCTDYSSVEDWSSGKGTLTKTVIPADESSNVYEFGFEGAAWINSLNVGGGGDWKLKVKADLSNRTDTGTINTSPTADIPPIIRLQHGCNNTIKIEVHDSDNDFVRCRWALETNDECGDVCDGLPNSNLNADCTISYESVYSLGWYAVAIQVEDYINATSETPLSSIPVQFLVNVYKSNASCAKSTEFVAPTPPNDACIGVPEGEILELDIVARVASADRSISEIKTLSPLGMLKSNVYNISATDWKVNVTWNSSHSADTSNVFCFTARETSGIESEKRCITLLKDVSPPKFINGTQSPIGRVLPNQRTWTINTDINIKQTSRDAYIRIYDSKGSLVEAIDASDTHSVTVNSDKNMMQFIIPLTLKEKETYYFLFDLGVVKGTEYCGADSSPIEDSLFWEMSIIDVTPPLITMVTSPLKTNATTKLEWTVDEPVSTECTLTRPTGTSENISICNNAWIGTNLTEGHYMFRIKTTDLEGNMAYQTVTWEVDTTSPIVSFTSTPAKESNEHHPLFEWVCNEPCTSKCSFLEQGTTNSVNVACFGTSIVWDVPVTTDVKTYTFHITATDDVGNTAEMHFNWTADFIPPEIHLCSAGENISVDCSTDLKPLSICNVTVADSVDATPSLSYDDVNVGTCGIVRKWKAHDGAGNNAEKSQQIHVVTQKPLRVVRYPGPLSVACGALENMTETLISLFEIEHPCDLDVKFSYKDNPSEKCGILVNRTWTIADNCGKFVNVLQSLKILEAKKPLSPEDGQRGVDLNMILRWQDATSSTKFKVYIWERGLPVPKSPLSETYNNYYRITSLKSGTRYQWQIIFLFDNNETYLSPIWVFETRKYADLVVVGIDVPPSGFTNNDCTVKWTVMNSGGIATQSRRWYDAVYISWDDDFRNSKLVKTVYQKNVIYPKDGYSSTTTFRLSEKEFGNAYIFIRTNLYNYVEEYNTTNNVMRSLSTIHVKLTPPPDLQVTSMILSGTKVFSGTNIDISWTVVNMGQGPTRDKIWWDKLWWSRTQSLDRDSKLLKSAVHYGYLNQNANYTGTATVPIPEFITGDYFFIVETDANGQVFEYINENNNVLAAQTPVYVTLTPPPDLIVRSIECPSVWKTGDTVNVTWVVENIGHDSPESQAYWRDEAVLMSTASNWHRRIGTVPHHKVVKSGEIYASTIHVYVAPDITSDDYNLTVTVDFKDYLFEFTYKNNNKQTKVVTVTQLLPDLKVQNFTVSLEYNSNVTVLNYEWEVQNIGQGNTVSDNWIDSLMVKLPDSDVYVLLQQIEISEQNGLQIRESYTRSVSFDLPFTVYGIVNFRLAVDELYHSTGDSDISNNVIIARDVLINLRAVDLMVLDNITTSKNAQAGRDFSLTYTVSNIGSMDVKNILWIDRIFIVENIKNLTAAYNLDKYYEIDINMKVKETYFRTVYFTLPYVMSGDYIAVVITDTENQVFEGSYKTNNKLTKLFSVNPAPAADLAALSVHAELLSSVGEDNIISVQWQVKNIGNSMDKFQLWLDQIMYKTDESDTFITLNTYKVDRKLESEAQYQEERNIILPVNVSGNIFLCIMVNSDGNIYEANSKQNNFLCQDYPVTVRVYTAALLTVTVDKITTALENEQIVPGSKVALEYTVTNIGGLPTVQSSWIDSIYLTNSEPSSTADLKTNGIRVQDIVHVGNLKAAQSYSVRSQFSIPRTFVGDPFIHVLSVNTDTEEKTDETSFPSSIGSYKQPIKLSFLLPNLHIATNQTIGDLQGGQPVTVEYVVQNYGNFSTQNIWFDSAYLSEDFIIDAFDIRLNTVLRSFKLDVGETTTLNISFILPLDMEAKSYFLVIVCDSRNDIFEEEEDDNEIRLVFDMETRTSSDIVITNVAAPVSSQFGSTMHVSWNVVNNGSQPASGYKCDSVYISEDRQWDISDKQLGSPKCSIFHLPANKSDGLSHSISSVTPNIPAQSYNTLVKTRSNVIDLNLDNNVAISSRQTKITYNTLSVGSSTNVPLSFHGFSALQIINVTTDQTLVINISSDTSDSMNNVYIKAGRPATRYDFDKVSDDPNTANKIISVPDTVSADYFILIENIGSRSSEAIQNIKIAVKYAKFDILDTFPRSLIPDAETTLHISGTLFPDDMEARLFYKNSSVLSFTAMKTYIFSSTEAFATFRIPKDTTVTQMNLLLLSQSLNDSIEYKNAIYIVKGTKGYLSVNVESPGRLRNGEEGMFKVNFQNLGDSDILVPVINVEAIGNGTIRLENELQNEFYQKRYLVFGMSEYGPAGILPPKSHGVLKFKTRQDRLITRGRLSMTLRVSEIKPEFERSNPFLQMKEDIRLPHYDKESWEPIWNNFISVTGNSTLSLLNKMSIILNEISLAGRRVQKVDDIIRYLVDFADAPFGDRVLVYENDVDVQTEKSVRLIVDRFMSARIGSRRQPGYIGNGWIIPLWDTKIIQIDELLLTLEFEKEYYDFINVDEDVYIHAEQGVITKQNSEFVLRRYRDSKEFRFDIDSLKLRSIVSIVDRSNLTLLYEKSLLKQIHHSDGPYVIVQYNTNNRIQSMESMNSLSSEGNRKVLYTYDYDSGNLREIITNSGTKQYSYNYRDSSLKYVEYDDGSMFIFEYNNLGHISARRFIVANRVVSTQEYIYSDGGMLSVRSEPDENGYNLTFSEKGDIILVKRKGFIPDKTVMTKNMETKYQGDMIVTRRIFDKKGYRLTIEDGNNDRIQAMFNEVGQLTDFFDGGGNAYHITLNENGTLRNISYPDGTNKTYRYFENNHMTTTQTGAVKRYEYNERKQLVMKDIGENKITSYEYDDIGNLVKAVNGEGEIAVTYKGTIPIRIKYPHDTVKYEYNDDGQLTHILSENGYYIQYRYNELGLVHQVLNQEENVILSAEYSRSGKITKKHLGNGAYTEYAYDATTGLLKTLSNFYPNGTLVSVFNYSYSSRNRRIAVETLDGTWKFKYDRAGQVISMTDPNGNTTDYTYDNRKNRKIVSKNGMDDHNTVNEMNQYIKYGTSYLRYDRNGNVIEKNSTNQERYTFDEDNRIIKYHSDKNQCDFYYDALGNLQSKICNGIVTDFLIDPRGSYNMDILEQIETEDGKEQRIQFFHGGEGIGLIAAKHGDGRMDFFMYDPLGSVVNILNKDGALLNSYVRNPFGEILHSSEAVKSMFTFIGQWGVLDIEEMPGIYFMRSRLYDSYLGRFISTDPLGLKAQSKNFYAYCSNNPVHFNDPRGTCPMCLLIVKGAIKGAGKGLFDYLGNTPIDDWTWGGATGEIIKGGLKGGLDPFRKYLPKVAQIAYDGAAEVLGNWAQHAIDGEAYSWKDAFNDFTTYFIDESESALEEKYNKFKNLNEKFKKACSLIEKFTGYSPGACQWKDKLKEGLEKLVDDLIAWILSVDPNDILGPTGFGAARFIRKDTTLQYKIRFENDANATAPAQRVYIEYEYNEHLDSRTFVMGEFGFGNFTKSIPVGSKFFQGVIDLNVEMGIFVSVFAGLDLAKQMVIWEFQTVDPNTGEAPVDPGIGFLPPNNGSTGQGFVTFSMKLKRHTSHLATVHANASIYFDRNEPIDAPNIFNTVDDSYPEMNGTVISETQSSDSVTLSLRAQDTGSGVKHVDLFQQNGEGFVLYKAAITDTAFVLNIEPGDNFLLLPIPTDQVGNRPSIDTFDQNHVINITFSEDIGDCECSGNGNCSTRRNICECFEGFYGSFCNSTSMPVEPPVLLLRGSSGFVAEKISLTISAKNLSGKLEDMHIFVSNFPPGTTFSKGYIQNDDELVVEYTEFGIVDMVAEKSGNITLKVRVVQLSPGKNLTRNGEISVTVYHIIPAVDIMASACFFKSSNGEIFAKLNTSVKFNNESTILSHSVSLSLPSWVHVDGKEHIGGVNDIADKVVDMKLNTTGRFVPFRFTVDVNIQRSDGTSSNFSRVFQVSEFCSGVSPNNNERATPVVVVIDVHIPASDNLQVAEIFEMYKSKVKPMLDGFYSKQLGETFIRTTIKSLMRGSLRIDHVVITTNDEETLQLLATAIAEMTTATLVYDSKPVAVTNVSVSNVKVL